MHVMFCALFRERFPRKRRRMHAACARVMFHEVHCAFASGLFACECSLAMSSFSLKHVPPTQYKAKRLFALLSVSQISSKTSSPPPPAKVMRVNLPFSNLNGSTGQSSQSNGVNNVLRGRLCTRNIYGSFDVLGFSIHGSGGFASHIFLVASTTFSQILLMDSACHSGIRENSTSNQTLPFPSSYPKVHRSRWHPSLSHGWFHAIRPQVRLLEFPTHKFPMPHLELNTMFVVLFCQWVFQARPQSRMLQKHQSVTFVLAGFVVTFVASVLWIPSLRLCLPCLVPLLLLDFAFSFAFVRFAFAVDPFGLGLFL